MDGFKKLPKMQCFKTGGKVEAKAMCYGGKMKEGGKSDLAQDKKVVKKAFAMHDKQEHPGEKTDLSKLKKGGRSKKEAGTVRKYKAGGDVTNVYEAKKKSGDKDNIRKVKQITPTKAASPSAAMKGVGNTSVAFKKGGNISETGKKAGDKDATVKTKMGPSKANTKSAAMKKGGKVKKYAGDTDGSYVDVKDPKALTDKIAREENEADRDLVMKPIRAVGKVISKGIDAAKSAIKGQGAVTETDRSNINKKKGGKVKRFAEGGFTTDEEKWLGGADRTDPFILARMRSALGERKPQGSYIPNANPVMDNRDVGMAKPYQAPNVEQDSGLAYPQENEIRTAPMRRAPAALPAGPSADERLRMRNARPYAAPNVEQDSGMAYPQGKPAPNMYANRQPSAMQRFFTATPAEQAANFQRGAQARKNFGKTAPGSTSSFSSLLDALNKPKV
jgi:hypothetical protein